MSFKPRFARRAAKVKNFLPTEDELFRKNIKISLGNTQQRITQNKLD